MLWHGPEIRIQVPPPKFRDDQQYLKYFVLKQVQGRLRVSSWQDRENTNSEKKGFHM
jgi:hypothetical protein